MIKTQRIKWEYAVDGKTGEELRTWNQYYMDGQIEYAGSLPVVKYSTQHVCMYEQYMSFDVERNHAMHTENMHS